MNGLNGFGMGQPTVNPEYETGIAISTGVEHTVLPLALVPQIRYRYCSSGGWSSTFELDEDGTSVAHYYPTISLDNSTGDLYAFWISLDDDSIDCAKNVSGDWDLVTLEGQNSYEKQYLTSIYAVPGENHICWQWTQNTSGNIEVIFDVIPEFEDIMIPTFAMMAIFFVDIWRRRAKTRTRETE